MPATPIDAEKLFAERDTMDAADLLRVLVDQHLDRLSPAAREAFPDMLEGYTRRLDELRAAHLSEKQVAWIKAEGERLEVAEPEAANAFSAMSPKKQAEHRARAARVVEPEALRHRPKYPPGDKRNAPPTEITPCPRCGIEGESARAEIHLTCPGCGHEWDKDRKGRAVKRPPDHFPGCMCSACSS